MSHKRDISWIEAARTLLMILILFTEATNHYFFTDGRLPGAAFIVFRCFLYIGVPAFLIISGFLAGLGLEKEIEKGAFIYKKFKALIIPFFVWNVIYILYFKITAGRDIFTDSNLVSLLTGYIHLYFLFILFQLFVIFAIFKSFIQRHLNSALFLSFVVSFCTYIFMDITVWTGVHADQPFEWRMLTIFLPWSFFFFLGVKLGHAPELFKELEDKFYIPLLLTGVIALAVYSYEMQLSGEILKTFPRGYFFLGGFFYELTISLVAIMTLRKIYSSGTKGRIKQYLIDSGRDTFAIYLAQLLVRDLLTLAFLKYLYDSIPCYTIVATALTWIIIQVVVNAIRNSGFAQINTILFGGR